MPFLVYRQDTPGTRFLVAHDLSRSAAQALATSLAAGKEHHQDCFVADYVPGEFEAMVQSLKLKQ